MSLLDAKEYDPRPAQRRNRLIATGIIVVVVAAGLWFFFRYWPEEHVINQFFEAIESKNFESAYGVYNHDPNWKQHADKYKDYTLSQFMLDWGPSGEYGQITSHKVDCATEPHKSGFQSPSGVIVVVIINNRAEPVSLWVEKDAKTITSSPIKAVCR